jgi:RNA polymerase sigma factor (TIGR02999 family)
MRHVLIDYSRQHRAKKRDLSLYHQVGGDSADRINPEDYLTIHTALEQLEEVDPQLANVVELRFFGGLSVPETADVLKISETSVKREWSVARVWLKTALEERQAE